jgi:hypothetical protein
VSGPGRWQGTTGENPTRDTNASVFVAAYQSPAAAQAAANADRQREIAWPGGKYVATATNRSFLSSTVSLTAACLSAGSPRQYSF